MHAFNVKGVADFRGSVGASSASVFVGDSFGSIWTLPNVGHGCCGNVSAMSAFVDVDLWRWSSVGRHGILKQENFCYSSLYYFLYADVVVGTIK